MTRRHIIAVAVSGACMLVAFIPPLWIRSTGTDVALDIRPVDPLSFFRGNYVDLDYNVPVVGGDLDGWHSDVYAVFNDQRPARVVRVSKERPVLGAGETCLQGNLQDDFMRFPQFEQFFVTADEGGRLETSLRDMVGIIRTTDSCRGVLITLEPER